MRGVPSPFQGSCSWMRSITGVPLIAPLPVCSPSLLRSFHFAMARRVTGVALSLHPCLWSCYPYGVYPELAYNTLVQRC